ncbi:MAG: acyl-CoA thioesterase [Pseudomonadales bacterium]|nr:acyl-CoA thioesterase [Pseudomonadales bacterium]MCP5330150.1 acyl-CoA thioesterase [Pseudomonadales bacterium]MCP5344468.1 acyl-CoA thioesterase [Pseudomonadales bacterium]
MALRKEDADLDPQPVGELALQTLAMPKDTNANGDIFGGWLVSQMDLAAGIATKKITRGRSATVAIKNVSFLYPVSVGSIVSCYAEIVEIGRSSMHINIEVWIANSITQHGQRKVAEGLFVFVAIDENGRTRRIEVPGKADQ